MSIDFSALVDALPIGILVHRDRRILYANKICLDALGQDHLDELAGGNLFEVGAVADRARRARRIADVEQGAIIPPVQTTLVIRTGRSLGLEVVALRIEIEGAPGGGLAIGDELPAERGRVTLNGAGVFVGAYAARTGGARYEQGDDDEAGFLHRRTLLAETAASWAERASRTP